MPVLRLQQKMPRTGTFESTLVIIGDNMFFTAKSTASGDELYVTDGTLEGTKMVMDINPGSGDASPRYLVSLNGKLYFQADNGTNGVELWESDGTEAGTKMVADVYAGADIICSRYANSSGWENSFQSDYRSQCG